MYLAPLILVVCLQTALGMHAGHGPSKCKDEPCQNGATCADRPDHHDYICYCVAGWTGINCDSEINECDVDPYPCENGGTCVDGFNSFTCICSEDYSGVYCEWDWRPTCSCGAIPECPTCDNQEGECTSTTWESCGNDRETCKRHYHMKDGVIFKDKWFCAQRTSCKHLYEETYDASGSQHKFCNISARCDCPCESYPCLNGGICTDVLNPDGPNSFTCTCRDGYTGTYCETDIDECESNPCLNGGTCVDKVNGYTCICGVDFSGMHCETDLTCTCPCGTYCAIPQCPECDSSNGACTMPFTYQYCADEREICKRRYTTRGNNNIRTDRYTCSQRATCQHLDEDMEGGSGHQYQICDVQPLCECTGPGK